MDLSRAVWRTSSYTNANSANCVEVADIPADFHKSSYSNPNSNNCGEVAGAPCASAVRDTQNRDKATLLFPSPEWRAFLAAAKHDTL